MQLDIPQQLNCPICMSIFKIPITTECGHSFCRSCLINSAKTKKVCPMCRQQFQSSPQKLKQDDALSHILEDLHTRQIKVNKKQDTSFQGKGQKMLLIEIKTQQLLLPYNKIQVSFELQNPSLLNKRQKFVARQQHPFNIEFGVISRIVSLNILRNSVYECTLQGKAFCRIEDDTIQKGVSQMEEEYYYRTCNAKQIIETSNVNAKQFSQFLIKFKELKDSTILHKIYRQIDHSVFLHGTDPLAMTYSILGILDVEDQIKYRIITLFEEEKRMQTIKKVVSSVKNDISFNPRGFLKVQNSGRFNYTIIIFFVILLIIIYLVNSGQRDQL